MLSCLILEVQIVAFARSRDLCRKGIRKATRVTITLIVTSISISVKPHRRIVHIVWSVHKRVNVGHAAEHANRRCFALAYDNALKPLLQLQALI
jgi:hypothetical protein